MSNTKNDQGTLNQAFFSRMYDYIMFACMVFTVVQVVIVVYVVFGRFVLSKTPKWGEELALLNMVWLSLFSASLAVKNDTHIRMSVVDNFLSRKVRNIRDILFSILNIFFSLFLAVGGIHLVRLTSSSIMPGSRLPISLLFLSVPVASFLLVVMLLYKLGEIWKCRNNQ